MVMYMLRVKVMVETETKNLSGNISGNMPFRGGNQLLEIYGSRAGNINPSQLVAVEVRSASQNAFGP